MLLVAKLEVTEVTGEKQNCPTLPEEIFLPDCLSLITKVLLVLCHEQILGVIYCF